MDDLIFSLNATMPIFLLMLLGTWFRKIGLISPSFVEDANQLVFKVTLPVLLFDELSLSPVTDAWDSGFVLFCSLVTCTSILMACVLSRSLRDPSQRGEFVQASFRSSAALLGVAFVRNMYGEASIGPLMVIASVPLYNVAAVTILALFQPQRGGLSWKLLGATLKSIALNPLILGIAAGLCWALTGLEQPPIMRKTLLSLHSLATPLGLMAMGASFDGRAAFLSLKSALSASVIKLLLFCALFLPLAVWMGYRFQALVAITVMLGSPTTVSCFVMARNMGYQGALTSSVVALTTLGSAFTLTMWFFLLRSFGLI